MSKQDRQGVRKASDIEQKYGLGEFMYNQNKSNQAMSKDITNLGESLSTYKTENDENISKMQENTDKQFKQVNESIGSVAKNIESLSKSIFNMVYPVGAIYISVSATNPSTLFGGTWERIQDRFLLAAGSSYSAGSTGGEANHTLTVDEMPRHSHLFTMLTSSTALGSFGYPASANDTGNGIDKATHNTGGGHPHNNMPPYLAVYVWKRTA